MPLTDDDKARARYHLGYPALTTAASLQFGVPALTQTNFLVESALNRILESMIPRVRSILKTLDDVELKLIDSQDRLAATKLDTLTLNNSEPGMLENEYRRFGYRLAELLGVPVYPYSARYRQTGSAVSNITVG
jgi:hypothetical protein